MSRSVIALLVPILVAGVLLAGCTSSVAVVDDLTKTLSGAVQTGKAVGTQVQNTVENIDGRLEKAKAGWEKINEGKELLKEATKL